MATDCETQKARVADLERQLTQAQTKQIEHVTALQQEITSLEVEIDLLGNKNRQL